MFCILSFHLMFHVKMDMIIGDYTVTKILTLKIESIK